MTCKVVKVYNNNLVLASDETGKQLVVISKGIGFGRKSGESFQVQNNGEQLFYILDDSANPSQLQQLGLDLEKVSEAVAQAVEIAKNTLEIDNDNLYDALMDHVGFAIQRLKMGLSIDNPFVEEISVLYSKEYELAQQAAEIINQAVDINLGQAECGFIALHLNSARKKKPISYVMKTPRVYSDILDLIGKRFEITIVTETTSCRSLLLSIDWLVRLSARGYVLENKLMPGTRQLLPEYIRMAEEIAGIVQDEMSVALCPEHQAFLAMDIYRFVQL